MLRFYFFVLPKRVSLKMDVFSPAPEFGGRAENFASYRQEVELWMLVTHLPLNRRAPALALAMDKMPRELSLALGVGVLKSDTGADKIMETSRQHVAPDASDAAFRDIISFSGLRRPHLTLDEYLPRFQMARRRAEARLPNDRIFPEIVFGLRCACKMRVSRPIRNLWFRRAPAAIRQWT